MTRVEKRILAGMYSGASLVGGASILMFTDGWANVAIASFAILIGTASFFYAAYSPKVKK